jgi:predicted nucleic acid-binding protein
LDTSALVKLYILEEGSARVKAHIELADTVGTSLIAYPETLSAFSRNFWERLYDRRYYNRMRLAFEKDWQRIHVAEFNRPISHAAGELIDKHGLRGFDSVHLATALQFKLWFSMPVTFLCFDEKLSKAAQSEKLLTPV